MNRFDVIVAGGGPAGSTAATFCAQRGLKVALFEHARFPRHKVCGDVINPNCWPVLEQLGVADKVRALPQHKIDGALFTVSQSNAVTVPVPQGMLAIRRSLFDACLLEQARSCGVAVFEGETVHGITRGNEIITRSGRYVALKGVIGADGRHSVVARTSGLGLVSDRINGHIAFQSHFRAPKSLNSHVQLHLFRSGYCGVVRVDAEYANLCLVTKRANARLRNDCEALLAITAQHNSRFCALGIRPELLGAWHTACPLRTPINVPAKDAVFLVGDALRVMEPFTGQGIFFALRTAKLAAQALLNSQCPAATYATAVKRLYREHARTNEWLRRLMYREREAGRVMAAVKFVPALRRWFASNVLSVGAQVRPGRPTLRAPWLPEPME
jgi:menaquinone-9 beta-reductase